MSSKKKILIILLFIICIPFIIIFSIGYYHDYLLNNYGQKIISSVVARSLNDKNKTNIVCEYVVNDKKYRAVTSVANYENQHNTTINKGDQIFLIYYPDDPAISKIDIEHVGIFKTIEQINSEKYRDSVIAHYASLRFGIITELHIDQGDFSNLVILISGKSGKNVVLSSENGFTLNEVKGSFQKDTINGRLSDVLVFKYDCEFQKEFSFKFQKVGYIEKEIKFNTVIPLDSIKDGFEPYKYTITLFKQPQNKRMIYEAPVANIKYHPEIDDFGYDKNYKPLLKLASIK